MLDGCFIPFDSEALTVFSKKPRKAASLYFHLWRIRSIRTAFCHAYGFVLAAAGRYEEALAIVEYEAADAQE